MGSHDTKCRILNTSQSPGTFVGVGRKEDEMDRLVENLALASVEGST